MREEVIVRHMTSWCEDTVLADLEEDGTGVPPLNLYTVRVTVRVRRDTDFQLTMQHKPLVGRAPPGPGGSSQCSPRLPDWIGEVSREEWRRGRGKGKERAENEREAERGCYGNAGRKSTNPQFTHPLTFRPGSAPDMSANFARIPCRRKN